MQRVARLPEGVNKVQGQRDGSIECSFVSGLDDSGDVDVPSSLRLPLLATRWVLM